MVANLIDFILMGLLFMPLFSIVASIIYSGVLPGEIVFRVMQEASNAVSSNKAVDFLVFLKSNKELNDYFFTNHGMIKIIINQIFQLSCLGIAIFLFWVKKQTTIGKMCLAMKIVDAKTLGKPSVKQLYLRLLGLAISILPLCLGVIWIAFDRKKQAFHDKIANTLVIKNI